MSTLGKKPEGSCGFSVEGSWNSCCVLQNIQGNEKRGVERALATDPPAFDDLVLHFVGLAREG